MPMHIHGCVGTKGMLTQPIRKQYCKVKLALFLLLILHLVVGGTCSQIIYRPNQHKYMNGIVQGIF